MSINHIYEDRSTLFVPSGDIDIGAVPSPGSSADYSDAAFTALALAAQEASDKFSVATSAGEVVSTLLNNRESDDGQIQEYTWGYTSPFPCEAAHHCHFILKNNPDYSKAYVDVYEYSVADLGDVSNSYAWEFYVDPLGNVQSLDSTQWENLSPSERRRVVRKNPGFQRVDHPTYDDPVYRARNPIVRSAKGTAPEQHAPDRASR